MVYEVFKVSQFEMKDPVSADIVEAECNIDSDCADIENSLCTVGGKCECLEGFLSTYDGNNPTKVWNWFSFVD